MRVTCLLRRIMLVAALVTFAADIVLPDPWEFGLVLATVVIVWLMVDAGDRRAMRVDRVMVGVPIYIDPYEPQPEQATARRIIWDWPEWEPTP